MSSVATETNPLQLTHCLRCGYALETLPLEGTCPECGIAYDQQTVVLRAGWSGTGGIATGSRGAMNTAILAGCLWVFSGWTLHWSGDHACAIALAILFTPQLALELAYRLRARRADVGGALLQCRFNRFGCLQCDLPEETLGFDDPRRFLRVIGEFGLWGLGISLIFVRPPHWALPMLFLFAATVYVWAKWRHRKALARARLDTDAQALMAAARDSGRPVPATPWRDIRNIRVGQFRGRTNRYYLTSNPSKSGSKRFQALNAEVLATPAQIIELKARIAAWQSAAAAEDRSG